MTAEIFLDGYMLFLTANPGGRPGGGAGPRGGRGGAGRALLTTLNMLGSGIIMLPAKIASVGGIGLLSWGIVCVSAVAMAYAFAYCGM